MGKQILELDSSTLSKYQRCAKNYYFSAIRHIGPRRKPDALNRGSLVHKLFETVNKRLETGVSLKEALRFDLLLGTLAEEEFAAMEQEEKMFLLERFLQYWSYYENDATDYDVVAAEQGFSKVLYEDDDVVFIYEGRIDLVVYHKESGELWAKDYKTQSRSYSYYPYSNQFISYAWASDVKHVLVDYIGLQKNYDKNHPEKTFSRDLFSYNERLKREWVDDTIQWFWRIYKDAAFLRNRHGCTDKFGNCPFTRLCEREEALWDTIIRVEFEEVEPWKAW